MMHFAKSLPDWNSLESVRRAHSDLEAAALVFFALLVLFDVLAHFSGDKKREKLFNKIGLCCFAVAVLAEIAAYPYGQRNDALSEQVIGSLDTKVRQATSNASTALAISGTALSQAKDALSKTGAAEGAMKRAENTALAAQTAASTALILARDARQEAASFEKDIASANKTATDAEQHLAEALREATQAEAELNKIRSPRSITNEPALIAALTPFKGTEYTLNVFQEDEAIQLTRVVDGVLGQAGWIRKQPGVLRLGLTSLSVFSQDIKDAVPVCVATGIQIHAHSMESLQALQSRAAQDLPKTIQAAIALRAALASSVSPSDERNVGDGVFLDTPPAAEGPVLICVGKKP